MINVNGFHQLCEFICYDHTHSIIKNATKLSDLSKVAFIYQDSLYLQTAV